MVRLEVMGSRFSRWDRSNPPRRLAGRCSTSSEQLPQPSGSMQLPLVARTCVVAFIRSPGSAFRYGRRGRSSSRIRPVRSWWWSSWASSSVGVDAAAAGSADVRGCVHRRDLGFRARSGAAFRIDSGAGTGGDVGVGVHGRSFSSGGRSGTAVRVEAGPVARAEVRGGVHRPRSGLAVGVDSAAVAGADVRSGAHRRISMAPAQPLPSMRTP